MPSAISGILAVVCGSIVAICFVAASMLGRWQGFWGRACILAAAAATGAVTLLTVVTAEPRLGDVRLGLTGMEFRLDKDHRRQVSFGGGPSDDVLITGATREEPRMGPAALTARLDSEEHLVLDLNRAGDERFTGVVMIEHPAALPFMGSSRSILGAQPFDGNSVLCVAGRGGFRKVTLAPGGERLLLDGQPAAYLLPRQEVALVRDYAAMRGSDGTVAAPATRSILVRARGGWQVAVLDKAAFLGAPGCDHAGAGATSSITLPVGKALALSFHALYPAEAWQAEAAIRDNAKRLPRTRLIEQRSLRLSARTESIKLRRGEEGAAQILSVSFDTPETMRIASKEVDGQSEGISLSFGGPGDRAWGPGMAEARFRTIGDGVAANFSDQLRLDRTTAWRADGKVDQEVLAGTAFTIGSGDVAKVRLERIDLDWTPLRGVLWLAAAGLIAGVAGTWGWRRRSAHSFIILALVDFLLGFRLLVAIEAAVIDPRPTIVQSVPAALLAIGIVPFLIAALAPLPVKQTTSRSGVLAHILVVAGVIAHVMLFNQPTRTVPAILIPLFAVAALVQLRPQLGTLLAEAAKRRAGRSGTWLLARSNRLCARIPLVSAFVQRLPRQGLAAAAVTMFVVALLLGLRLLLPEDLGISTAALYTPLIVALMAFAFTRAAHAIGSGGETWRSWLPWAVLLPVPLAWPFLAGDHGYAIVHLMPYLILAAMLWIWAPSLGRYKLPLLSVGPLLLFVLAVTAVALTPSPLGSRWPDSTDMSDSAKKERRALIRESLDTGTGSQRLIGWFAPEQIATAGTREAEALDIAFEQMREYSRQGPWGRGFLNQPEPTELRLAHLSDYVSAVHLLAPFGRLGTAGFLLVLLAAAAACSWRRIASDRGRPPDYRAMLGICCLWTLAGASAYMILSNLQLVPFTGRNVYLMAASSPSDLIEGLVLAAMALVALGSNGEER